MNGKITWNRRSFFSGLGLVASSLVGWHRHRTSPDPRADRGGVGQWPDLQQVTGFGSTGNVYEELVSCPSGS